MLLYGASAATPPDIWSVRYDGAASAQLFAGQGASNGNAGVDVVGISPASNVVFYRERPDLYLDLFNVPDHGGSPTLLCTTENHYGNVVLLPNENLAFVRDGALYVMGIDGSGGRVLVSTPGAKQIQAVFPDGRILFETVHAASDDLSIANPDGSTVVALGPTTDCQALEMLAP